MRWIWLLAMSMALAGSAFAFVGQADSAAGALDTTQPTVTTVTVLTARTVQVTFSKIMLTPGVTTPSHYTISGGQGTLTANPTTVTGSGTGPYTLTWTSGEMLNGAPVTVTAAGVQDTLGNLVGTPSSGNGTGIGTIPTIPGGITLLDGTPATPISTSIVHFGAAFSETMNRALLASDLQLTGTLAPASISSVTISGTNPNFVVAVALTPSHPTGTVGIATLTGTGLADLAGNPYAGGDVSLLYTDFYLSELPPNTMLYTGALNTYAVTSSFGPGTTYQWRFDNGVNPVQNGPTTQSWTISYVIPANQGWYWCEINNSGTIYTTNVAYLQVQDHLQITAQPVGGTGYVGVPFTFTVTTSGGYPPLYYVWRKDGVVVFASHAPVFTFAPQGTSDAGNYTVEVSDSNTDTRTSLPASLTISTLPLPVFSMAGMAALVGLLAMGGVTRMRKK